MRQMRWTLIVGLGLMVASLISTAVAFAFARDEPKIKLDDLPKAVMAAAKKAFPEAKMVGAVKETADDDKNETIYVVELKVDDKAIGLAIDPDGTIAGIEKEIDAADLPKAVTRAVGKRFPNGKVAKVEEVSNAQDIVVYELDVMNDGKKVEVVMAPNGKILDIDEEDDDEDQAKDDKAKGDKDKGTKSGDNADKNKDKKQGDTKKDNG